jgi:hypothetical protein
MKALLDSGLERLKHPMIYVRTLDQLGLLEIELGDEASGRKSLESFLDTGETPIGISPRLARPGIVWPPLVQRNCSTFTRTGSRSRLGRRRF